MGKKKSGAESAAGGLRGVLLASTAVVSSLALITPIAPAHAQFVGTNGGNASGATGGAGGTAGDGSVTAGSGGNGTSSIHGNAGGGTQGGSADDESGSNGAGGGGPESGGGSAGSGNPGTGGGGGGGGGRGVTLTGASPTLSQTTTGGNGGNGATGSGANLTGGGAGGGGGNGVVFTGTGTLTINATATGGNGGNGAAKAVSNGNDGGGGRGGNGLIVTGAGISVIVNAAVTGGNGGTRGGYFASHGSGGIGIVGSGLSVTLGSTVSGGLAGDGSTRNYALDFTGGANALTLNAGWGLNGGINVAGSLDVITNTDTTLANVISGSGALSKSGSGTLTLSGNNTYTGGTTVNGGTLLGASTNAFGTTGLITLGAGATLDLGGHNQTVGSLAGTGLVTNTGAAAALTTGTDNTSTVFSGTIQNGTGAVALTKTGTGTQTLTGSNSYTGLTTISAGTLEVGNGGTSGTLGSGAVVNNGTLAFNRSDNLTVANVLSGSGTVTKTGAGTLTLTANNTYSGTTTISAGTLEVGNGGTSGTLGSGAVVNNGTLAFNRSDNLTVANVLSGSGTVTKTGAGTLTLTGINTYTGLTTINGGTLMVGDAGTPTASLAGSATVQGSGTLAGHGTVWGDVDNRLGGTVSPGGSIGTLHIGGNYTQDSASRLAIEVSPTAASQLAVSGTAALNGTLALTYTPGVYSAKSYTIVQANSGLSGQFSTISGSAPAGLTQALAYSGTQVTLSLNGTTTVAPAKTGVVGNMHQLPSMAAHSANGLLFDHFTGGGKPDSGWGAMPTATQLAFVGGDQRVAAVASSLPQVALSMGGWVRATGSLSRVASSSTAPGYSTGSGGLLAGIDRPVSDNLSLGIASGYSRARLFSRDDGDATLDSPRIMLYGTRNIAPDWNLDAAVGYAFDTIATRRNTATGTATASHHANEFTAEAQVRTKIEAGAYILIPTAGFTSVLTAERGYTESGAGGNNLAVAARTTRSLQPFVRLLASRDFESGDGMTWSPNATLGYARETMPTEASSVSVGGGTFTADSQTPARDRLTLGAGLTARYEDLSFDLSYQMEPPTGNTIRHSATAEVRWKF